jgi:uncharacterized protein YndB with AHSA1/START domain
MKKALLFFFSGVVCLMIHAEILASVTDSSFYGFTIKQELIIKTSPDSLYHAFTDIGRWWDSEHTYSGKAANLSLEPFAGGCFCEILANGGGVHHMTVLYVDPGKIIRLEGGLGPLQAMAVNGIMTVVFTKLQDGTKLTVTYTVGGYTPGGLLQIASAVDNVLGLQVTRLKKVAESHGK